MTHPVNRSPGRVGPGGRSASPRPRELPPGPPAPGLVGGAGPLVCSRCGSHEMDVVPVPPGSVDTRPCERCGHWRSVCFCGADARRVREQLSSIAALHAGHDPRSCPEAARIARVHHTSADETTPGDGSERRSR